MKKVFLAVILMALMFTNSLAQESKEITLQIEKGEKWHHNLQILFFQKKLSPQIAIWSEDEKGNYLETLYISEKTYRWYKSGGAKRKESLPVWRNRVESVTDGAAGATETLEKNRYRVKNRKVTVYMEVNNSFDYNSFYTKSSSKSSGQPSLVYAAQIDTDNESIAEFKLIGHGSSDGSDGVIYKDMSNISDALKILKYGAIKIK